jgi:hypothetical protein
MLAAVQSATWKPADAEVLLHLPLFLERLMLRTARRRRAQVGVCADSDSVPMRA